MPRPIHFEISAEDPERAAAFYRSVFGWKVQKWEGPIEYWLIDTQDGTPDGINGGLMQRRENNNTVNTIGVDSVDEVVSKATAAGATVAVPKMPIPGMGWLCYLLDTEGTMFGVMESDPNAQ